MAGLPSWRETTPVRYTGAGKWGTGVNPVHSKREGYEGRNLAPGVYDPPDTGLVETDDYGYMSEDNFPYVLPSETDLSFMQEHPNLGDPSIRGRADMPAWGYGAFPIPEGTAKRRLRQGMNPREIYTNVRPAAHGGDGWENKRTGDVLDSRTADVSQLFVQTSERQRDAVQSNARAQARGTDDPRSEIPSRIPGMRLKIYSGGERHDDMTPREQSYSVRPFLYRTAGTGPRAWMAPNEMYVSEPIERILPPDTDEQLTSENTIAGSDFYSEDDWYG
jgi:hypothetical protein